MTTRHAAEFDMRGDEKRLIAALLISIAIHATVLTAFPELRTRAQKEPEPLRVDLVPLPPPAKPVEPPPPAPPVERSAEPVVEPPPLEAEPKPQPKPKPKPVRKKEAPKVEPPKPEPVPIETEPQPAPAPVIAVPSPPPAEEPPVFEVPQPREEPPPPPAVVEPAPEDAIDDYGRALSRLLDRHKQYPQIARRRGWEGMVEVKIDIGAEGRISDVKVSQSSGYDVLDQRAIEIIQSAQPLPPAPASLQGKAFVVTVPIHFQLKN
jgi:protein TonB